MAGKPQGKRDSGISRDDIKAIAAQMKTLPAAKDAAFLTKHAAIIALNDEIKAMRGKGYTIDQISAWLTDNTRLTASAATIRSALASKRNRKPKSSGRVVAKPGGSGAPGSSQPGKDATGIARAAADRPSNSQPPAKGLARSRSAEAEKPPGAGTFTIGNDDV